jgi:hypothetical protein
VGVLVFGLVVGVLGVFGVVFTTFLISRELTAKYGHADALLVHRATKDRTVSTRLRFAIRACGAVTALGAFLVVKALLAS